MTVLSAQAMMNWFLYGRATTPTNLIDESLIRPDNAAPLIPVDATAYMADAGRFFTGCSFPLVTDFFQDADLPPGTYTKTDLAAVKIAASADISGVATVDAGAQEPLAQDVLDLSQYDAKVSVTGATIGVNGTSFNNFEKLILSSSANTVKVTSLSSVGGLQEIDAGANPPGSADVMDFSSSSAGINFSNSSVSQGNATLKLTNFEDLIGSSSNDTIDLSNISIQFVNGSAGDDTMTAGSGGSTLDGSTGNNVYIGGDGIDTFVIGNGEYAQQGTNATFEIQNASASDRLVLRLDELPGLVTAQIGPKGSSSTGESIFRAIRSMPVSIPLYTSRQASFRQAISRGLRSFHARMSGPSSGTIPLTMNGTARSSTSRSRPRTEISG